MHISAADDIRIGIHRRNISHNMFRAVPQLRENRADGCENTVRTEFVRWALGLMHRQQGGRQAQARELNRPLTERVFPGSPSYPQLASPIDPHHDKKGR